VSTILVRPSRRADREQLAALVNAHIQAVVPGVAVSVNTVLSQLERNPGEFIVDPWVAERATLVAEQRGRVVAAAHLLRCGRHAPRARSLRPPRAVAAHPCPLRAGRIRSCPRRPHRGRAAGPS
jgi:hypothetical protein